MSNFDFLAVRWPTLAKNGAFAEKYFYTDTNASILKLRLFAEELIGYLLAAYQVETANPYATQKEKINALSRIKNLNPAVIDLFEIIRMNGNKAAHQSFDDLKEAAECFKAGFKLACWFYVKVTGDKSALPKFEAPKRPQRKTATYNVVSLEQYQKDLDELRQTMEQQIATLKEQLAIAPPPPQQVAAELAAVTDSLEITEDQTRELLINVMLKAAGWLVDNGEAVQTEYPVSGFPSPSGKGKIDYLLMGKDGKPLAVVEAKRTARDPEEGQKQAVLYADAVLARFGVRPVIFYTNGHETWLWDDQYAPPRQVWGFYRREELEYLFFSHQYRKPLSTIPLDAHIAGRAYQIKGIKSVLERFEAGGRRALLVMATGTGKTRTVIALTKAMMEAHWVKRVLFLADRDELLNQAKHQKNSFKTFMPEVPAVRLTGGNVDQREANLYFATYQTMAGHYGKFGVGFFDLVICDESHRSIYKTYGDIIEYFDAYCIGLTATPVDFVSRNTYRLFECAAGDPTFYYSLEEACNHQPPYLLRPRKIDATTRFLRRGIKWEELAEDQRRQLEEEGYDEARIQFDREQLEEFVTNDDTNRFILQNLMEKGEQVGGEIGKSIIFARNIAHARLLEKLFNELYPQYHGKLTAVIHSQADKHEVLLNEFKEKDRPRIAISVDMLDTGIDVPEVVNLVFAKPVYSKVKFIQMMGRGTRLCPELYGPGRDKQYFIIFDHWKNFAFFNENTDGDIPAQTKSLKQLVFERKVALLQLLLGESDTRRRTGLIGSIREDIAALPQESVSVRRKYRILEWVKADANWQVVGEALITALTQEIAPLMQWVDNGEEATALWLDNQLYQLQGLKLTRAPKRTEFEAFLAREFGRLQLNLNHFNGVRDRAIALQQPAAWPELRYEEVEQIRETFRGLMRYRNAAAPNSRVHLDVADGGAEIIEIDLQPAAPDLEAYTRRVKETLEQALSMQLTIQKIRKGMPLTPKDVDSLVEVLESRGQELAIGQLAQRTGIDRNDICGILRQFIGVDEMELNERFAAFVRSHSGRMSSLQMTTLEMIKNDIIKNKGISLASLYEAPYTLRNAQGVDGIFGSMADEVFTLIGPFEVKRVKG